MYVASQHGLAIYDISAGPLEGVDLPDPQWKQVGWLQTDVGTMSMGCCDQWYHGEVLRIGDYLYTLTRNEVFVWSLTDPANPTLIRSLDRPFAEAPSTSTPVNGGVILGGYLPEGSYSMLDIRDPSAAIIRDVSLSQEEGYIKAIDEDRLLYCTLSTSQMQIFDIADPYHPRLLGIYPLSLRRTSPYDLRLYIAGGLVFTGFSRSSDLKLVLDISDPSSPSEVNVPWPDFLDPVEVLPNHPSYFRDPDILAYRDTIFTLRQNDLQVYSMGNLDIPLATLELPNTLGTHNYLSYSDSRLVIRTATDEEGAATLRVSVTLVDVENPARPQLLAGWEREHHPASTWNATLEVATYGDHLYVHMNEDGVGIFRLVPN